jgi:hypothetical protein
MARNGQSSHGDSYCAAYSRAKRADGRQQGGLSEELNSRVSEANLWSTVFELVSGLWAQNTKCMSANLSVESDFWNYCECSVFIINSFVLSVVSIKVIC